MEQTNLSTPALNARNIFTCRLSDNQVLLYAPLAGSAAIISEDEVSRLEDSAARVIRMRILPLFHSETPTSSR